MAAPSLQRLSDDTVEYRLFPPLPEQPAADGLQDILSGYIESYLSAISHHVVEYIWHRETFNLSPSIGGSLNDVSLPPHIYGRTHFGDNIEDEWFIVFLLFSLSRTFQGLVISVQDNDGEFLLIESSSDLPKWMDATTCENRVYLYGGNLHVIPYPRSPAELTCLPYGVPDLADAVNAVREFSTETRVASKIESHVLERIQGYPMRIRSDQHVTQCRIPVKLAGVISRNSNLLSAAVQAFYSRDAVDLRACRDMRHFPPDELVKVNVTLTRYLYGQLVQQEYRPSKRQRWVLPPVDSPEYKSHDLGLKLTCGFEILCARYSKRNKTRKPNRDETNTDSLSGPGWEKFRTNLKSNDYFRGELEGSVLYKKLMTQAEDFFRRISVDKEISEGSGPDPGEEVLQILDGLVVDVSYWKSQEDKLQPPDDDSWLDMTPEDLDQILARRYGNKKESGPAASSRQEACARDLGHVTESFKNFMKNISGLEGAEFPDDAEKEIADIDFDPEAFSNSIDKLLGISGVDGKQSTANDSPASGEEESDSDGFCIDSEDDDDDIDFSDPYADSGYGARNADKEMLNYMYDMDSQLSGTNVGKSFEKSQNTDCVVEDSHDDQLKPVEVDINLVKNLLESYSSQQGLPGPASNILHSMGIRLPQNDDNNTEL